MTMTDRPHQRAIDLLLPVAQALQDVDDDARFRVARLIDEVRGER